MRPLGVLKLGTALFLAIWLGAGCGGEDGSMQPTPAGSRAVNIRPAEADSGFLDVDFIHDVVTPSEEISRFLAEVSPDTLASYILHLQDYGTRHTSSQEVLSVDDWIVRQFLGYGYTDVVLQDVRGLAPKNVVCTKPGRTNSHFRIVVGGHYDSMTFGEPIPPEEEAPGADDNASGTAATLEMGRLLADAELDATVQFVLFTGQEQGLFGSMEFVTELVRDGVPHERLFFINMDMIGNIDSHPWRAKIYYDAPSMPLARLWSRIGEAYTQIVPVMSGHTRVGDNFPFQQAGYPAVYVLEGDFNPYYHSRQDLLLHLEVDYEAEVVRTVLAEVLHLALAADPPDAVAATGTTSGDLLVEWSHSTDADVLGYKVELLNEEGAILFRQSTADNHMKLDPALVEGTGWVRVRATDCLGDSRASDPVLVQAGITIEKLTNEVDADFPPGPSIPVGEPVVWTYAVTNTGQLALTNVIVTDDQGVALSCPSDSLAPGQTMTCTGQGTAGAGQYRNVGAVTAAAPSGDQVSDTDPSHYFGEGDGPTDDEGCGHGFWKNHTNAWLPTGYAPEQTVETVFAEASAYPEIGSATLLDALKFKGGRGPDGAARILLRQAVASALNAAHPDVCFPHTVSTLTVDVNAALAGGERKDMLELAEALDAQNNLGCPF